MGSSLATFISSIVLATTVGASMKTIILLSDLFKLLVAAGYCLSNTVINSFFNSPVGFPRRTNINSIALKASNCFDSDNFEKSMAHIAFSKLSFSVFSPILAKAMAACDIITGSFSVSSFCFQLIAGWCSIAILAA